MLPLLSAFLLLAQNATPPPELDLARAKRVFDNNCAGCHGPEGSGGKGPRLAVPRLFRARTDKELAEIIEFGISGTEMPVSRYLGPEALRLVTFYVRTLGANATPPRIDGDTSRGKELFDGKGGCARCHTVGGHGWAYGPDLSDVGGRRSAATLRDSLVEPNAEIADGFVPVSTVTAQEEKVSGLRVNRDNFTIQILEPSGRFRSFRKDSLLELHEYPNESAMPSYKTAFSDSELRDLVAYLSSLRGAP
jgi:putative heme-binding domain-containing protein